MEPLTPNSWQRAVMGSPDHSFPFPLRRGGGTPAPEYRLENPKLIGKQALVSAGAVVPVPPVDPALVPTKNFRVGKTDAEALEHRVRLALEATVIERHHKMPRLGMGSPAILIVTQGISLDDVG